MYRYNHSSLDHSDSSNHYYTICRYKVNHAYVEGLLTHPNISLAGGDFKNAEYYVSQ